ncbi:MAG: ribosome maturation factor RimM [Magnetospiraceae bacterium]
MDHSGRICLGVITGAHGLRGQVRVTSFTDVPEDVAALGPLWDDAGSRQFTLHLTGGAAKGRLLATVDGVRDRTAAEALKGTSLFVDRDVLPPPDENEYFYSDLIGLSADLVDGTVLGTVRAVYDFGAGDVVEVEQPDGALVLVPFTEAAVPDVDLAAQRLVIDPPPGLLEPATPEEAPETEEAL